MHTKEEFDAALKTWLEGAQAISDRNMEQYPAALAVGMRPVLTTMDGERYVRVVRSDPSGRSVHAFIEKATGNVLKAASWKAPAKHARGNIFDESNGLKHMGCYGPAYLR